MAPVASRVVAGVTVPGSTAPGPPLPPSRPPPGRGSRNEPRRGGDGVFRGRVLLDGPVSGRQKLMVVKDVAVCGKIDHLDDRLVVGEGGGIRYAVVSVTGVPKGECASRDGEGVHPRPARMRVLAARTAPAGGRETEGPEQRRRPPQHPHLQHAEHPVQHRATEGPQGNRETFDMPERIPVRCDVHGWMSSWVVVVDHPYHAVTDEDGRFEISGIPPGTVHRRLLAGGAGGAIGRAITIGAPAREGGTTHLTTSSIRTSPCRPGLTECPAAGPGAWAGFASSGNSSSHPHIGPPASDAPAHGAGCETPSPNVPEKLANGCQNTYNPTTLTSFASIHTISLFAPFSLPEGSRHERDSPR